MTVKETLQSIEEFQDIPDKAIDWFIDKSECIELAEGEFHFVPGDPVDHLFIVIEGVIDVYTENQNERNDILLLQPKSISGVLPFSRMSKASGYGKVVEDVKMIRLHKKHFTELVGQSYQLAQNLVAVMSDRVRNISQFQYQDEKLKALGKISAGLAHELNNPASAIVRSADTLRRKLKDTPEKFKRVMLLGITPEETDQMNAILFEKIDQFDRNPVDLSLLEKEDRLDEVLDWLEDNDIPEADEVAEILVDFDISTEQLDAIKSIINGRDLGAIIKWFDDRLNVEKLVKEIFVGSTRVADLVGSIKSYSHMDQGSGKAAIDLHEGIRSTLTIFNHQLKQKSIQVDKSFDTSLPKITGATGALNQVWTNLISNAIDAMPEQGGLLKISTYADRDYICVDFHDNGKGIPEEIQSRIWEPFFTTKEMGAGTGIGLDIVKNIIKKHRGSISLQSEPGNTRFKISLLKDSI